MQGRYSSFGLWRKTVGLWLGPLFALCLLVFPPAALSVAASRLAAVLLLVVTWWITEAVPIPVTGLLGCAFVILLGVAPAGKVLAAFGDQIIFLFLGSFILARAMQVHGVDRRIAYTLLSHPWVGASTTRSLWTVGLVACGLSMWMSNTACTAMLFPVAVAIAKTTSQLIVPEESDEGLPLRYTTALLLMLAYAASIGGLATPVGTPPNLIGLALIEQNLDFRIGFFQWMLFGVPLSLILLVVLYAIIRILFPPEVRQVLGQIERMHKARQALGPVSPGERNSLIAFGVAIVLWLGPSVVSWVLGEQHPLAALLSQRLPEGVAAILAALILFLLPVNWPKRTMTLSWEEAVRIDWGTILLFGSGIALGKLIFETGWAEAVGKGLIAQLGIHGSWGLTGTAVGFATFISETCSNTASANMAVPVMLAMAKALKVSGVGIGIAATLGSSMGFALPISTPPNAIVYGSKAISIRDMIKAGLLLDIAAFLVIWFFSLVVVPLVVNPPN